MIRAGWGGWIHGKRWPWWRLVWIPVCLEVLTLWESGNEEEEGWEWRISSDVQGARAANKIRLGLVGFFFSSAFDVTRILFQKPSLLWAHRVFLKAGGIVERSLACCQTAWYEFTMNLANLIKWHYFPKPRFLLWAGKHSPLSGLVQICNEPAWLIHINPSTVTGTRRGHRKQFSLLPLSFPKWSQAIESPISVQETFCPSRTFSAQ